VPAIVADAGDQAVRRFLEFFAATIRNKNTRMAYYRAVCRFFTWCDEHKLGGIADIEPLLVAAYIEAMQIGFEKPSVKQHLSPIRPGRWRRTSLCHGRLSLLLAPPIIILERHTYKLPKQSAHSFASSQIVRTKWMFVPDRSAQGRIMRQERAVMDERMAQKIPLQSGDRMPLLTAERNRKMAASAHAYVRGSTVRFYEWLEASNRPALPEGPAVWICGDCHVGNLGPVASTNGAIAIQVRDLDQTVIGNPAHDLIRLGLSLAMAARGSDLPGVTTVHILERMIEGYEAAFAPEARGETTDSSDNVHSRFAS
jgi:hypothetical protein